MVWQGEAAKIMQWQHREGWSWQQLNTAAEGAAAAAGMAEGRSTDGGQDFRMLAWQLLDELCAEHNLDTIMGSTELEAPPKYERWVGPAQAYQVDPGWAPVVLLDTIPVALQGQVLAQVAQCNWWVILERKQWRGSITLDLEAMGESRPGRPGGQDLCQGMVSHRG